MKSLRTELKNMPSCENNISPSLFQTEGIQFPVNNDEEFEKLEVHLESEEFSSKAVRIIFSLFSFLLYLHQCKIPNARSHPNFYYAQNMEIYVLC